MMNKVLGLMVGFLWGITMILLVVMSLMFFSVDSEYEEFREMTWEYDEAMTGFTDCLGEASNTYEDRWGDVCVGYGFSRECDLNIVDSNRLDRELIDSQGACWSEL